MILHTLNATPDSAAFRDCVRLLKKGDALLLLSDGVYAAFVDTPACAEIKRTEAELFVLEPDAAAAGLLGKIDDRLRRVDFDAFAALSERYAKQQAWY